MSEPRRTTIATVSVVIEIETGSWGPECTIGQITSQATESALDRIRKILGDASKTDDQLLTKRESLHGVRLVSVSKVVARCTEER